MGDRDSEYRSRKSMPWQGRALQYIDLVPELNFASRFYARMMKPVRFYPGLLEDDGTITRIIEGDPVDVLNRIQDPGGGRSMIQWSYGRLIFTTGEGNLFGRDLDTDEERWSFVWSDELKIEKETDGSIRSITHKPSGEESKVEYGPNEAVVYKMWTPHPRMSGEADSPMRSVLDIAEELIILTQAVRATGVTRLTNGVLFMPNQIMPLKPTPEADEDPDDDPFVSEWADHMSAQVENFGSAEAREPFVAWVDGDWIDKIKHLPMHDPQTDYMERELRKEAVDRLSIGLDMPPEALKGLGDTNHWAAMQILGDMWKSHGSSVAQQFASDIAEVYQRPTLREMEYEDWQRAVLGIDASEVVVRPDRSDDADKALDRGAISLPAYRRLKNIPEKDGPSDEERQELLEFKRGGHSQNGTGVGDGADESSPADPGPEGDSGRRTRVVAAAREIGASEMALMRCRELAGTRLRHTKTWNALAAICLDCQNDAQDRPLGLVATVLGPDIIQRLHLEPMTLVRGGADTLRGLLKAWGYSDAQSEALAEMVEIYAARTLFDERISSLPAAVGSQIEQMKELTYAL